MIEHTETTPRQFWNMFQQSFGTNIEQTAVSFYDLPAGRMHWMGAGFDGYAVHRELDSSGRALLVSSLRRGGLDALGDYLPTDAWANWAANLFRWSLDSEERELSYAKASPSAADLIWLDDNPEKRLHYGVDPFSLALWGKATLGHNGKDSLMGDRPVIAFGGSYQYNPLNQGQFKAQLVIPLPDSWQFNASCSLDGNNIARMDPRSFSYAARLEHVVGHGLDFNNLFYIGLQSRQDFLPKDERDSRPAGAVAFQHRF